MKKLKFCLLIISFLFGVLAGCNQTNKNADAEADLAKIKEVAAQYRDAVKNDDLDLFMDVWAEDAIRLEPGFNAIKGREKIREHFKPFFDQFYSWADLYGEQEWEVSGDLAFSYANCIVSTIPKEGGDTIIFDVKVVDVFKRQVDGSWKIYIDCPTPNPEWDLDPLSPDMLDKQDSSDPLL
ncbi:MAG: SgcJ/EcaC family oxidoreductase [Bacteroidales bacterium]|nr:MAG: SgcJ/EcaC family oxidoreductase [Bacteroidales bacterium]